MINLKELRVDNWVYNSYTNQNIQVYPMMIPQLHRIEKENGSLKDCNIEPIPLTEEILLKCGFEKEEDQFVIETDIVDYIIELSLDGDYILGVRSLSDTVNYFSWDIKHLHQLQNLYYFLCGEELNVNV